MSELAPEYLIEQLQARFASLSQSLGEAVEVSLDGLRLGPTPKGTFFTCGVGGNDPVLNPNHKVVKRILAEGCAQEQAVGMLVSAIFSVLNRVDPSIEDHHEREFHSELLGEFLGS